jgi:hypothetical protein
MNRTLYPRLPLEAAISLFVITLFVPALHAELNLTPQREEFSHDGVKMWQLRFETGTNKKATYNPPPGWVYSGGSNHLDLRPEGKTQFRVIIAQEKPEELIPFDDEGRKALTEQALRALPQGSEQTRVETQALSPLQINGKETYLIELSYTYYGEKFARYCLLLNLKEKRLRFELTCRESDYKELSQAFQKSLYSWRNI